MPGPFDFLQNIGKDVSGAEQNAQNAVGGWLKGLLPSQPAQPQSPPLPTPSRGPSPLGGATPGGGVSVPRAPSFSGMPQGSGDSILGFQGLADSGFGQGIKDIASHYNDVVDVAHNVQSQLQHSLHGTPFEGSIIDPGSAAQSASYVSNVLNAGAVDPIRLVANPELWFTPDTNTRTGTVGNVPTPLSAIDNIIGSGSGHNYLNDMFRPAVKAVTGEDVPDPTTAYEQRAKALTAEGNQIQAAHDALGANPTQAQIDAYNAKLIEFNTKVQNYKDQYNKSADWWQNSNTAKTLAILGQIGTAPAGFAAGMIQFIPQTLADPVGSASGMVDQVKQGVDFVSALMDPNKRDHMTAQELAANVSNIVNLAGMIFGPKGLHDLVRDPKRNTFVDNLQKNIPDLQNPPDGPVAKAAEIQKAREASPVPEPPAAIDTRIQDLQSSLAVAQRQLHTETDPIMKKTLVEQVSGISDEIRNLQGQPRTTAYAPITDEQWQRTKESLGLNMPPDISQKEALSALYGEANVGKDLSKWTDQQLQDEWNAMATDVRPWNEDFAMAIEDELTGRGANLDTSAAGLSAYGEATKATEDFNATLGPEAARLVAKVRAGTMGVEEADRAAKRLGIQEWKSLETIEGYDELGNPRSYEAIQAAQKEAAGFNARRIAVRETVREKQRELGPSKIAPEVIPERVYPDYMGETTKILGPNYQHLEPRPEDFSLNVRAPRAPLAALTSLDQFARLTPVEIRAHLEDTPYKPVDLQRTKGNAWIDPSGQLAVPLRSSEESVHSEFASDLGFGDENVSQTMMDNGWIKKSTRGPGMVGFGVHGLDPRKVDIINRSIEIDSRSGIPPYPYQIADETTGRPAVEVPWKEFVANGFDITPTLARAERTPELYTRGEQIGTQTRGEAGQAGAPSTTVEGRDRPEGTPEGTTLAAIGEPRTEGQSPIAIWQAGAEPAGTVPGGGGAAELKTRLQNTIVEALNTTPLSRGDADPHMLQTLIDGVEKEINKIPDSKLQQFVEERSWQVADLFNKYRAKYDPDGYIKHLNINRGSISDAYFHPDIPRTFSFNPQKLLAAGWAHILGSIADAALSQVKDSESVTPENYAKFDSYIRQWITAKQTELDENMVAEELFHAYDMDHVPGGKAGYLTHIFYTASRAWKDVAARAGLGISDKGKYEHSILNLLEKHVASPGSVPDAIVNDIADRIAEYRASSFKVFMKTPLAGYTYRVLEVIRNEIREPGLIDEAAQAIGEEYQTLLRPAIQRWLATDAARNRPAAIGVPIQRPAPGTRPGAGAVGATEGGGMAAAPAVEAAGFGRSTGTDQGSLGVKPPSENKGFLSLPEWRIMARTVTRQAITDLENAGWPADARWEQFAQNLAGPPDEPATIEAMKMLDKMSPKSQEVFLKAADLITEQLYKGEAPAGEAFGNVTDRALFEQGTPESLAELQRRQEAAPEVPRPATAAEVSSPLFQHVQKEIAAAQVKLEQAGPIIDKMVASGESLKEINTAKAQQVGLRAYIDALKGGATLKRAAAISRDANTRELFRLAERNKESSPVPELEEEPYNGIFLGKKYEAVDIPVAEQIIRRLRNASYEGARVMGIKGKFDQYGRPARFVNLADFFDGLFAEDREAERAYKTLPSSTKEYLQAKIGYRGVPKFRKKGQQLHAAAPTSPEVAKGTENYINQADLQGLENVVKIIPQKGGFAVVRHGSTARNGGAGGAERLRGTDDIPLNDQGESQAERLGAAFKGSPVAVIYVSPMKRAIDTANAIAKTTGAKVIIDKNLGPWNIGDFSGKDAKQYGPMLADYAINKPNEKLPNGESFNDYLARYIPAVRKHMQDALGLDGITLEVNHTRGYRMVKSLVQSREDPSLPIRDAIQSKEEIGPGGIMAMENINGHWQIAGNHVADPFDPSKKVWVNGEVSQRFDVPAGEKGATPTPAIKEDPVVTEVKKNVKEIQSARDKVAKKTGEISPRLDLASQVDTIAQDPTHPANGAAVEAKMYRDLLPKATQLGGAAWEKTKADYAAALQKFTSKMAQIEKEAPKAIAEPAVVDHGLFAQTSMLAEKFRKRIDKGEDPNVVARDAAKAVKMSHKDAISALRDAQMATGKAQSWAPAFKDIILGKASQKIRENRLSNKPIRKTIPFEQDDLIVHQPNLKPSSPEKATAAPKTNKPVPAIAKTLQRDLLKPGIDKPFNPDQVVREAAKDVARDVAEVGKKTNQQLRQETQEIHKQINTPSPDPFAGNLFAAAKKLNLVDFRAARRKAGLEEPGMRDGAGGQNPPPPDGPGNVLAGWDDARDPVRAYGGKWAKLAENMDLLMKHYAKSLDPGSNQLHHFVKARLRIWMTNADRNLIKEVVRSLQDVLPAYKGGEAIHHLISDAIEEKDDTARMELKKQLTPQQAAFVDMWRAYEDAKGKMKVDNDLMKAAIEDHLSHILKFDENGKALRDRFGNLRPSGLSPRLRDWVNRSVDEETGQAKWPTLSALRAEFGAVNVESDLIKIFTRENLSFSPRLRYHQMLEDLTSHVVTSAESFGLAGKNVLPYEGHPVVPISQLDTIPARYKDQLDTVNIGPAKGPLSMYRVYRPLKDQLERLADLDEDMNKGANLLTAPLRWANNVFKIYKFAFNPLHMYNVISSVDMYLDRSPVPLAGALKIWKNAFDLKNGKVTWDTAIGKLNWDEALTVMADNGLTVRDKLVDTANLGALQGHIANSVKVFGKDVNLFNHFHDAMWVQTVWMLHVASTMHLADFYAKKLADASGGKVNEAQFNQALRLAAAQSNHAVGFLDRMDMSRNWNVIGNTVNFANAWTTMQIRNVGAAGKAMHVPFAEAMSNFGGGKNYLDVLTSIQKDGGLTPEDMKYMDSVNGRIARRFVINGSLKLLATSMALGALGSEIAVLTGQPGAQLSLPWQNYQKDPTHTFDIYGGIDPQTGKQIWYHNPLYNALSELINYAMAAPKAANQGEDWYNVITKPGISYLSGKQNPFIGQLFSMISGVELSRWMAGYSDPSIHADTSITAIENALSAKGINLPVGLEDRLIYAIREVGPVPGFAPNYGKNQTLSSPGDIVNAVGPGKYLGVGDFLNALQSGNWSNLVPKDLGNLAMFLTGSRQTETATPATIATDNQIAQSVAARTEKQQLEQQMLQAAYKGDYQSVAAISNQLGYDNNQMVNALLYPPSGSGGGVAYHGLPYQAPATSGAVDTIQGYPLKPGEQAQFENIKKTNFLAMYNQVIASPEWKNSDGSERAAMLQSFNSQLNTVLQKQYAQDLGIMGGAPITNNDIQVMIDNELQYRALVQGTLETSDAYITANPTEQARMMKEYKAFADNIAYKSVFGPYKGVPPDRVQALVNDTITTEEQTRQYLQGSVFYQMATQQDQARMLTEYGTLSRTLAEKYALGQGQGPRGDVTLMASQVPMVLEKTIQVEETAKALLHSTDYYQTSDLATQQSLDSKYETLARSLAFSPTAYTEDPNIIVENSILAEESYFGLQNQFGGGQYLKLMAQQLSDMELTLRQTSDYSPKQIAAMEKGLRAQFLAQNPAYAQYLRAKTQWSKDTTAGQIYTSLNNSEYAAQDQLAQADALSSSVLTSGTTSDPYFDPATNMGLTDLSTSSLGYNTSGG